MSRGTEASDRAAQWIIAQEEAGWSAADQADLEAWLAASDGNKAAYWRLKFAWEEADRIGALGYMFAPQDEGTPGSSPTTGRSARRFAAAILAACVAIALIGYGLSDLWRPASAPVVTTQFATPRGSRRAIELADGSRVELNTASRVRVAVTNAGREIWLDEGEAYFEVRRRGGQPFVVHAGTRTVTVLGTKFSVSRVADQLTVSVLEGRVRVDQPEGRESLRSTILGAGEIARMSGSAMLVIARSEQRVQNSLAWREGMLTFDEMRLADVAAQFNRYNRKRIVIADAEAADMRIGGTFPANDPDAFVRLLRDAYGLRVAETPEAFTISR